MSGAKPFPAISGSCVCGLVRYRLLTSPLYVYACHCADCQKITGSAFGIFINIERHQIQVTTPTAPHFTSREKKIPGVMVPHVECPTCKTELWSPSWISPGVIDVRVGTLDFPSLFEPDIHIYVDSKLDWLKLPDDAKIMPKNYNFREHWPKSSLKRLELCVEKEAEWKKKGLEAKAMLQQRQVEAAISQREEVDDAADEGEKTPTAIEPGEHEAEDDEAFERRFRETEKALQERLEKLSLKLKEEESQQG